MDTGVEPLGIPPDRITDAPYDIDAGLEDVLLAAPPPDVDPRGPFRRVEVEIPIQGATLINYGDDLTGDGTQYLDAYLEDSNVAVMWDGVGSIAEGGFNGADAVGASYDFTVTAIENVAGHLRIVDGRDIRRVADPGSVHVSTYDEDGPSWADDGSTNVRAWGVVRGPKSPCPFGLTCWWIRTGWRRDLLVAVRGDDWENGQCREVLGPLWHTETATETLDFVPLLDDLWAARSRAW